MLVRMEEVAPAAPFPHTFSWSFNGVVQGNYTRKTFGYPFIHFAESTRPDAGVYTLTATNYFLDTDEAVGTGTGVFTLDVLCM